MTRDLANATLTGLHFQIGNFVNDIVEKVNSQRTFAAIKHKTVSIWNIRKSQNWNHKSKQLSRIA